MADADAATERIEQFLQAKVEQDKRYARTSSVNGLVAMIRIHDKETGKFQNFPLMADDLQTLIDGQKSITKWEGEILPLSEIKRLEIGRAHV